MDTIESGAERGWSSNLIERTLNGSSGCHARSERRCQQVHSGPGRGIHLDVRMFRIAQAFPRRALAKYLCGSNESGEARQLSRWDQQHAA